MSCEETILKSYPPKSNTLKSIPSSEVNYYVKSVLGGRGRDAYEHAVASGHFNGTLEEWFESLTVANLSGDQDNILKKGSDGKLYASVNYETTQW